MEALHAVDLFSALGDESRLAIFRLLIEAGPADLDAIGAKLGLAPATWRKAPARRPAAA